jgi:hypothetical protein
MGLNIKSTRAEAAIRELAKATGEGLTETVEKAVQERLERERIKAKIVSAGDLLEKLKPLQKAIADERRRRKITKTSRQLMDELYDEDGLPR